MENNNILTVIDELGALIEKYKTEIKFQKYEIENLNKKITQIENYIDFYTEDTITQEDYKKAVGKG